MDGAHRRSCSSLSSLSSAFVAIAVFLATANHANAQAWVLRGGEGSVSISYQRIDNTGHRRTNGFLVERGKSIDMGLYLEGEYALTNRLTVTAGLPYVFAKYIDPNSPAPPIPFFLGISAAAGNRAGRILDLAPVTTWLAKPLH